MTNINESESVDLSQVRNMRKSIVDKSIKKALHAALIMESAETNLNRSTGYLECKEFNLKVENLINFYESMSKKSQNPLENAVLPIKRKSAILEGISNLETNKLSQPENCSVQTSDPVSKKIKKSFEETNTLESEDDDPYFSLYNYEYHSCPEVSHNRSYEQMNDNFSLPNHDSLNHSYAEHFIFDNVKQEELDLNNSVSSKNKNFTHWEISNKNKTDEDQLFANREKLYVNHDHKGRINGYYVDLLLSTSEEDAEKNLDEDELKALGALAQFSQIKQQPVDFDKSEEVSKITYTNFKYPPLDLAEDLLRCASCDLTPHYYQVVRKLFDCARLGDFASLAEKQKVLNAARNKRKAEEAEKAKKRPKRASSKPAPVAVPTPASVPGKTYSFKRKASNKSKQTAKRKNLSKSSSDQIKPDVKIIEPFEEKINDNELVTKNIEPVPIVDKCNLDVKPEVELKKINTVLFDDERAELISMGLLPASIGINPLYEESEVSKLVKTELTSMGLLPAETDCASLEKVNDVKVKKFKCDKCDATFTSSNGKKYHINKVHTTEKDLIEKPYKCLEEGCFKKFTSKNGLKSHRKNKHPAKNTL